MAYCPKCGKEINSTTGICPDCGGGNVGNPQANSSDSNLKTILAIVAVVIIAGGGFFGGFSNIFSSSSKVKDITKNPPIVSGLTLESYEASYNSNLLEVEGVIKTDFAARNGAYVNVTAYDKNHNTLDTLATKSFSLSEGESWHFTVNIYGEDIAYYAITTVNYL